MKIQGLNSIENNNNPIRFKGKRIDRNVVQQLTKNNKYSLTEPNQRRIREAIAKLGNISNENNIKFLLDTAAKTTYGTNIKLQDQPKNKWKTILLIAAANAAAFLPALSNELAEKFQQVNNNKSLNSTEKVILMYRKHLLDAVDLQQIEKEVGKTAKDFEKNLDYFIVSSETTLEHKKYVLERLNYFMSDEYEINPQLKDKKSIVVAEMINDMAINVPGNEIPNIKAVDQKQHGMCAAISIVRKKLAYEDKPNYVDSILSELDASPYLEVYDRNNLGSNKKIQLPKVRVDFDSAIERGYRIIDASTLHWMQIAQMSGASNIAYDEYTPFNKENFDVKTDSFYNIRIADDELEKTQIYYQALLDAQSVIKKYKAQTIKKAEQKQDIKLGFIETLKDMSTVNDLIKTKIINLDSNLTSQEAQKILAELYKLEKKSSTLINKDDEYSYISNEEYKIKSKKIQNYLTEKYGIKNIDNKKVTEIYDLIEYYHSLRKTASLLNTSSNPIAKAQNLYDIGAAFRYQVLMGLKEKNTLRNTMFLNDVSDEENLLLETIEQLIKHLENNSADSDIILEQLNNNLHLDRKVDREDMADILEDLLMDLTELLTQGLDELYASLGFGNRKIILNAILENTKQSFSEMNKKELESWAALLNSKKDVKSMSQKIEKLQERVLYGDEKDYKEILNLMGCKSQITAFVNEFQVFVNQIQENYTEDNPEKETIMNQVMAIQDSANNLIKIYNEYANALKITDKDGNILYSANAEDVVIKKLENKGEIIPAKNLAELQEHLIKITKNRSETEMGRKGKLIDKSLMKFSNNEKNTLKEIEQNVNAMYSYVERQLEAVQKSDFKTSLEELKRIIGVNTGNYWVNDGGKGLATNSQIRILEYMTGRPHYSTQNIEKAINKIKNSPYSGISSSSVMHDDIGMHAQYIADITPMTLVTKDENGNEKEEVVEVLFQDNTWGAIEKENTWTDSKGLLRTDYGNNYGGELGYITDDKYRNGNLVSRIENDMITRKSIDTTKSKIYKKLRNINPYSNFSMPQYDDIILDGHSPNAKSMADQIHDLLFIPSENNIKYIKKRVEELIEKVNENSPNTDVEKMLEAKIRAINLSDKTWKSKYNQIKNRIFSKDNPIKTKEQYDALANDDYLKVLMEKIAIKKNYQLYGRETDLAKVRNTDDLESFKKSQKIRALNSFKYSFAKTPSIIEYLANNYTLSQENDVKEILKKYNIPFDENDILPLGLDINIDKDKFDGSAKNLINTVMDKWSKDVDKITTHPLANKEIKEYLRKYFEKEMYFKKSDISNGKIQHLIKFIDREFDPASDEELVEIFNHILDMTNAEFKKEILTKVKLEDLDIKNYTGYNILKKIQIYDEATNTDLINTVYYDNFVAETNPEKMEFEYRPKRFYRSTTLDLEKQSFNSLYRTLYNELSLLTLPKLFNKYKNNNIEKYNAYPAYPKLDYISDDLLKTAYSTIIELIASNVQAYKSGLNQIENYKLSHKLANYLKKLSSSDIPSAYQYKNINNILGQLITQNYGDKSLENVLNAAEILMEYPQGTAWKEYIELLTIIVNQFNEFESVAPIKAIQASLIKNRQNSSESFKAFTDTAIQKRYQDSMTRLLNDIKQAYINGDAEKIVSLQEKLYVDLEKNHILQNPEELLNTYITSLAKNSKKHVNNEAYENYLTRCIQYATLAEMQEIMMEALDAGIAPDVKKMFETLSIQIANEEPLLMSSGKAVMTMIHKMILSDKIETASMFIEKFGLADIYIKYLNNYIDFNEMEKLITNAQKLILNFNNFQQELEPFIDEAFELLKIENIDYNRLLNTLKKGIMGAGIKYELPNSDVKILLKAIDDVKIKISETPDISPAYIYQNIISTAKFEFGDAIQKQIDDVNDLTKANAAIFELLAQILISDKNVNDIREDLINRYQEMIIRTNSLINNLPTI